MAEAQVKQDASPVDRALQMRESLLSLLPTLPVLYSEPRLISLNIWMKLFTFCMCIRSFMEDGEV